MVDYNPGFPDVLGNQFLATRYQANRVWAGSPARMLRLPSTVTETITSLHLSATVEPLSRASIPTLIDIIEEGAEITPAFQVAQLVPNNDSTINGWTTNTGATTNLFQAINEDVTRWPGPAQDTWIQNTIGFENYECSVNATNFASGGGLQNARIGYVEVRAILGCNLTGYRKIRTTLAIGGTEYNPAGGGLRDVHAYGSPFVFWWGELNPATELPWTPADIADFVSAGTSRIRVRGATSTTTLFPKVYALQLWVYYVTTENRKAVAVWRRPENLPAGNLQNIETTALLTMPAGTANWAKQSARNYLYYWRQAVAPALYGAVIADDVRWNGLYQDLGPGGQPAGIVYPLHSSGVAPPPSGVMAAHTIPHDQFGRPQVAFDGRSRATYAIAFERSDAAFSADSQPYRMAQPTDFDLSDMERVSSAQKVGQRVTPSSTQTYLGVRFPILPPPLDLDATLTVSIHRVTDGVQMGGSFQITADQARALPAGALPPDTHSTRGGIRYVTGFLASGATLTSGIAYEIRLSTDLASYGWVAFLPDCSLAPSASFGGSTNGAFIGATHHTDRELAITLVRQPDAPTGVTAVTTNVAVTTFSEQAITVPHVLVSWTQPAVGLGASFARYELERQVAGGAWQRIANIVTASVVTYTDRGAPRGKASTYRIRAVGTDGRFSAWATTSAVTPTETRPMLVLTSDHRPDLYFVHLYEIIDPADAETIYPVLSTDHDEVFAVHGADYQVVFIEAEDRGVGWRTRVSLRQAALAAKGQARFDALLELVRALDIPYVCAMDHQGNHLLGHVSIFEGVQTQPDYGYTAQLTITPTHTEPVPTEVL